MASLEGAYIYMYIYIYTHTYTHIHLFTYTYILEKAMAPHSSTLAWKIPGMEEPRRLQSMGSLRVGHDWATSLSLFTFMYWRRKWQRTPVFLPGESQGRGSLLGFCLWGRTDRNDWSDLAAAAVYIYIYICSLYIRIILSTTVTIYFFFPVWMPFISFF